jgi:hypothetical protein
MVPLSSRRGQMKDNFEVFRILPGGALFFVEKSPDLQSAIAAAFLWAVKAPGRYTVRERSTSELIFEVMDFETREREVKGCDCKG